MSTIINSRIKHVEESGENNDNNEYDECPSLMHSDEMQSSEYEGHYYPMGWIAKAEKCFKVGSFVTTNSKSYVQCMSWVWLLKQNFILHFIIFFIIETSACKNR